LDKKYFNIAKDRIENHKVQESLFWYRLEPRGYDISKVYRLNDLHYGYGVK
jgi:hypothetical protein